MVIKFHARIAVYGCTEYEKDMFKIVGYSAAKRLGSIH